MDIFELIKMLSQADGISGDEGNVRKIIIGRLNELNISYKTDPLGNVIADCKGKKTPDKKLMVCAHMDEVGLIATNVTSDGLIKCSEVGGIDNRVLLGRAVRFYKSGVCGVIGTKAVHQQSNEERGKSVKTQNMFIDIGSSSKENTLKKISLGDSIAFLSEYIELSEDFIASKALDDRVGCALMLKLMENEIMYDTTFVFTVQEEVGTRGAKAAAYSVNPDMAIVVETTTAADISGVSGEKQVCSLGDGPVVSFMDRATIYDKELYTLAFGLAEKIGIPCQTKSMIAGGNDSSAIHVSRGGVRTLAVSLPCRYLHSPSCVIKKDDVKSTYLLLKELISKVHSVN